MHRWGEVLFAATGLAVASPVLLLCAVAIALTSSGPILFRQERVGRGGKSFNIIKFRTMVCNAREVGGPLTIGADARVTWVGVALRKFKLDELPQLWNVLRGDMKFVGPRPEVPEYVRLYDEVQRAVLLVPPGITDPASIQFRNESAMLQTVEDPERFYVEEILPQKLAINAEYLEHRSGWRDMGVIAETVRKAVLKI